MNEYNYLHIFIFVYLTIRINASKKIFLKVHWQFKMAFIVLNDIFCKPIKTRNQHKHDKQNGL